MMVHTWGISGKLLGITSNINDCIHGDGWHLGDGLGHPFSAETWIFVRRYFVSWFSWTRITGARGEKWVASAWISPPCGTGELCAIPAIKKRRPHGRVLHGRGRDHAKEMGYDEVPHLRSILNDLDFFCQVFSEPLVISLLLFVMFLAVSPLLLFVFLKLLDKSVWWPPPFVSSQLQVLRLCGPIQQR